MDNCFGSVYGSDDGESGSNNGSNSFSNSSSNNSKMFCYFKEKYCMFNKFWDDSFINSVHIVLTGNDLFCYFKIKGDTDETVIRNLSDSMDSSYELFDYSLVVECIVEYCLKHNKDKRSLTA